MTDMGEFATVMSMHVGHAVLFAINRKEVHVNPRKPFDGRMQDGTWVRYKDVFRKLCFIRRTDNRGGNRQPYQFMNRQGDLYDKFVKAAQGGSHVAGEPPDTARVQPNAAQEQSDPAREQSERLDGQRVRLFREWTTRRIDQVGEVVGAGVAMRDVSR